MGMHGCLNFNDDLIYDDCSRMNAEVYRNILATNLQENATRFTGEKHFILHQDNDPKRTASSVKEFIRTKKRRLKAELWIGCIKGWEKHFKAWEQESGDVYGSQTHCSDYMQLNNIFSSFTSALGSTVTTLMLTSDSGMNSKSAALFIW